MWEDADSLPDAQLVPPQVKPQQQSSGSSGTQPGSTVPGPSPIGAGQSPIGHPPVSLQGPLSPPPFNSTGQPSHINYQVRCILILIYYFDNFDIRRNRNVKNGLLFCFFRSFRNILVHKRRNTAACRLYRRHRRYYSTQARDNCRHKRAVCTERFNWIKADRRLRSTRRTLRPSRARSASKTYTCSNHRRRRLTRRMPLHRKCIKTIYHNTASYVNFIFLITALVLVHTDI